MSGIIQATVCKLVSTRLFFLTCSKLVLRVQQIACIVVQVALQHVRYDDKIVHIVPILGMSLISL